MPHGSCCNDGHSYPTGEVKPDHLVCKRERAWREYVRERDMNIWFHQGTEKTGERVFKKTGVVI